jgi:hypothetical protein
VRSARVLCARILGRIERQGYDVFASRRVPLWEKAATVGRFVVQPAAA